MTDWIFQANPKRYDVHAAVARSSQDWWNTPRCRDRIALNDRVWLQIVGRDRPGIYYLATIASLPYESPEGEFGPWHTDIRWDYRIDPPLARSELADDPVVQSFWAFRGFQGSNVPVPAEIASRLMELARPRLVGLGGEKHPGAAEGLGVSVAIERHNSAVRQKLRQAIIALDPTDFELFAVRVLHRARVRSGAHRADQ